MIVIEKGRHSTDCSRVLRPARQLGRSTGPEDWAAVYRVQSSDDAYDDNDEDDYDDDYDDYDYDLITTFGG